MESPRSDRNFTSGGFPFWCICLMRSLSSPATTRRNILRLPFMTVTPSQ